ncbi:hypothetical protein T05_15922 [Trichinella murrelli]|uniref:Uncharacterized protein n=1 Tax=Trichinella murrelli TaxID=144512 RepID=A0A0V0TC25_9BILA|nr:hypothetical protein T05_15922 [Trichinella murrelli]
MPENWITYVKKQAKVGGPAVDPTRTTNRPLARRGSARYLRRRSTALSTSDYVVMVRILWSCVNPLRIPS